jgi:membrane protease subunit HflC
MTRSLLILAFVLALLWARSALYTVDAAEFVYVTRFGDPVTIQDGGTSAGLHVKAPWPVDSVIRIDRRVQSFDLPAVESLTRDPVARTVDKTLAVDAFVTWKIPDAAAADRFVKAVRTPEQAKKILGPLINGRLAAVISTMPIDDLIGVADTQTALAAVGGGLVAAAPEAPFRLEEDRYIDERTERVRRRLLGSESLFGGAPSPGDDLRTKALAEYGLEIIDIRVRRFSYPAEVRSSIAERIRSERAKKVADYESDGRKRASDIVTDADRAARTVEATARAERTTVEGRANAEAAVTRASAYEQDRDFYLFHESLRSFRKILSNSRDLLLLSTKHPLLKPALDGPAGMKKDK